MNTGGFRNDTSTTPQPTTPPSIRLTQGHDRKVKTRTASASGGNELRAVFRDTKDLATRNMNGRTNVDKASRSTSRITTLRQTPPAAANANALNVEAGD